MKKSLNMLISPSIQYESIHYFCRFLQIKKTTLFKIMIIFTIPDTKILHSRLHKTKQLEKSVFYMEMNNVNKIPNDGTCRFFQITKGGPDKNGLLFN